jgi:type I restriction-modification system DNA methylase subunit
MSAVCGHATVKASTARHRLSRVDERFNNQALFSDHHLESVVPDSPDWDVETEELQASLSDLWTRVEPLLHGHEGQTEEHWIRPVLHELGFSFQVQTSVRDVDGGTRWPDYALFGDDGLRSDAEKDAGSRAYFDNALAVADAKVWDAPLDRKGTVGTGANDRNPNHQIDLYLRTTDRRWAILTNGRLWRIYSRDTSYRLDSFYEVDLIDLLGTTDGSFKYFWLFFRALAFQSQPDSFLDQVRAGSREYAESLSARVKDRIYEALAEFVNGFFAYSGNRLDPTSDLEQAYAGSLILLYRILFVLYAEAHALLPLENTGYRDTYSLYRIKTELADRLDKGTHLLETADNYYRDLRNLFEVIDKGASGIDVPAYNGGLFAEGGNPFLAANEIGDLHLARGLDLLARVPSSDGGQVFVDFNTLQIRHLGDIYEGLLEYRARYAERDMVAVRDGKKEIWKEAAETDPADVAVDRVAGGTCYLTTENGERRATGSYYTPQEVVEQMVNDSVGRHVSVLESEFSGEGFVEALLSLRICDPAMGSGHFLVEVVDHLARAIVRAGAEGLESDDGELVTAKRVVVERCVYGVDPNPLAVELAKLSLWLATVARGRPLSFIDTHLLCGNSLIGADLAAMGSLGGGRDDQMNLVEEALGRVRPQLIERARQITEQDPDTLAGLREKHNLFAELNSLREAFVRTADLWTARSFGLSVSEDQYLHSVSMLGDATNQGAPGELQREVDATATRFRFHHWALAFPEVFLSEDRAAGFDAVITNPPYVSAIARSATYTGHEDRFWRRRFTAGAKAFDLYLLFMELALDLARPGGWVSLITPNKMLSAPYAQAFRGYVIENHALVRLIDASRVQVFEDPSVYPVISLFRAGPEVPLFVDVLRLNGEGALEPVASHPSDALTRLPEYIWAFLVLDDAEMLLRIAAENRQLEGYLGLRAVASTATSEADRYASEIREEQLSNSPGWKLVNTGTISPFSGKWGLFPLASHRKKYLRPVIPFRCREVSGNRRDQYWAPKLIFRKLCLQLEAQVDAEGDYASMNTNFVLPGEVDLHALGALMHSSLMTWIFEGYFGALRMGGGYMQAQAPQLRVLPIPALPTSLNEEELGQAVEDGNESARAYTSLIQLGGEWSRLAGERHERRSTLVTELFDVLGLVHRREEEPAFVLPRQAKILDSLQDRDAEDLKRFWKPLRQSAKQLGLSLTQSKEQAVLGLAQSARADLIVTTDRMAQVKREVDEAVFGLYGLSEEDRQQVVSGHVMPPGIQDDD